MTKSEEATRADLSAVKAEIKLLEQELAFTKIPSPFDGQIGRYYENLRTLVHEGTVFTRLVSLDPMWIYWGWSAPPSCGSFGHQRGRIELPKDQTGPPLFMGLKDEDGFPHRGTLAFFDNHANPSKGRVAVRADFPNPTPPGGHPLKLHGMSVRLRLPVGAPHRALLVQVPGPPRASGVPLQDFLYLVDDQNKVVRRSVKWGQEHDGLTVVKEGLNPGDRVIVGWTEVPRPGDIVKAKPVWMPGSQAETSAPK